MVLSNRILLVDDEEEFLHMLAERLSRLGFMVEKALQGAEALVLLGQKTFDAVVVDVLMPEMDGLETLKRIKEAHPSTEVILLTGHGSLETALRGMRNGAFDYFIKPCDPDRLAERIQRAREKKEIEEKEEG